MTIPWHLSGKPWAVQAEGLKRAKGHAKFGTWIEMGLGKTSLTLNEFIESDDTDIALVLAPNSFVNDWTLAPTEWGVPWVPTGLRKKDPLPFDQEYCLYAVNYELAREKEYNRQLQKLLERRRTFLIIDESSAIKNPNTSTYRAVIELAKRAKMVRELNGTPISQDITDVYGQLRALGQLNGMEFTVFKNRFVERGGFMGRQIIGTRNEVELARIMDSCTFRALKSDWRKDLPPKSYKSVHLEMSPKQRQHYQLMLEEFYTMIEEDEITVDMVMAQMAKLRQIGSCVLLDHGKHFYFEKPENNPKLKATLDIIATCPGKVLVSYFYRPSGQLLFDALSKEGLNPAWIKGDMRPSDVTEEKRRFNDDSDCRVCLGQQDATARGHTLIGQTGRDRCSTIVFFENSFSYYMRAQLEDRNHRGAQDQECLVIDLLVSPMCAITVDALTRKKDLAQEMDRIVAEVRKTKK